MEADRGVLLLPSAVRLLLRAELAAGGARAKLQRTGAAHDREGESEAGGEGKALRRKAETRHGNAGGGRA